MNGLAELLLPPPWEWWAGFPPPDPTACLPVSHLQSTETDARQQAW